MTLIIACDIAFVARISNGRAIGNKCCMMVFTSDFELLSTFVWIDHVSCNWTGW